MRTILCLLVVLAAVGCSKSGGGEAPQKEDFAAEPGMSRPKSGQ